MTVLCVFGVHSVIVDVSWVGLVVVMVAMIVVSQHEGDDKQYRYTLDKLH